MRTSEGSPPGTPSVELDVAWARAQFPGLRRSTNGRPSVFADAPGGTQVPASVIEAVASYLRSTNANTGGAFVTSIQTDRVIADARLAAADLLGANPDEIVFGPNMTTLAFALSRALTRVLSDGDEVVVTRLDHDANIAPWRAAAEEAGGVLRWVDLAEGDGTLDVGSLGAALSDRTRLVAFSLASNALGTVTPAHRIVPMIRRAAPSAVVIADAVHVAPHRALDVVGLDVDLLFCSAYKFFGPHVGVMYGRGELLRRLQPYKVRPAPEEVPWRWEAGTLDHEGLAGSVAAVEYLADLGRRSGGGLIDIDRRAALRAGMEAIRLHEATLSERFLAGVSGLPGVRLYGIEDPARIDERTPTFALRLAGRSPRDVARALADRGVFVWDGNYYAMEVMERLGLEESGGAVRVGFCHYNTIDEVDRVLEELSVVARCR